LFDTFDGFSDCDFSFEDESVHSMKNSFADTSAAFVLNIMPHKNRCVIKQGYFPESASDVDDSFVFVSLDMDLYKPTLEGLKFFYPKLATGGYIFIHDYFHEKFTGVEKAVRDFVNDAGITFSPLGDDCSVVISK
jgi:O-methyltransferase